MRFKVEYRALSRWWYVTDETNSTVVFTWHGETGEAACNAVAQALEELHGQRVI